MEYEFVLEVQIRTRLPNIHVHNIDLFRLIISLYLIPFNNPRSYISPSTTWYYNIILDIQKTLIILFFLAKCEAPLLLPNSKALRTFINLRGTCFGPNSTDANCGRVHTIAAPSGEWMGLALETIYPDTNHVPGSVCGCSTPRENISRRSSHDLARLCAHVA
jgi:hypothetical protein